MSVARCCRSQSSGTKTNRRTPATSSPAISTSMRGSPCGNGGAVVSAKVKVQSVRAFSFAGRADTSRTCRCRRRGRTRACSAPAASARAAFSSSEAPGPTLGQRVFDAQDIAASGDEDAPFFGAIGDVAFERRDPDAPARAREDTCRQLLPPLVSGDGRDELVRPAAAVVNDRHHAPLRSKRHAARGQRLARDFAASARADGEHRRVVAIVAIAHTQSARAHSADRQPCGPCALPAAPSARLRPARALGSAAAGGVHAALRSAGSRSVHAPDLPSPEEHDPQRHERQHDDHQLLEPDAGRVGEEDRQREPARRRR